MVTNSIGWKILTGLLIVVGLALAIYSGCSGTSSNARRWIAAAWTLVPPIFFWLEWLSLPADFASQQPIAFANYQQSQALASQLWAAIAAILAGLYLTGE